MEDRPLVFSLSLSFSFFRAETILIVWRSTRPRIALLIEDGKAVATTKNNRRVSPAGRLGSMKIAVVMAAPNQPARYQWHESGITFKHAIKRS